MQRDIRKREIYDLGMAVLAIAVVFVLLLNLMILFDIL